MIRKYIHLHVQFTIYFPWSFSWIYLIFQIFIIFFTNFSAFLSFAWSVCVSTMEYNYHILSFGIANKISNHNLKSKTENLPPTNKFQTIQKLKIPGNFLDNLLRYSKIFQVKSKIPGHSMIFQNAVTMNKYVQICIEDNFDKISLISFVLRFSKRKNIWNALCDLVPLVKFKKRKKHLEWCY